MKKIHPQFFAELRRRSCNVATGWLVTRTDGVKFGFTSSDKGFTLGGVEYAPTNSFSGSAAVSRNNLSVDNMSAVALISDDITDADLRAGVYDNAKVQVFWCCPDHPEWGALPIRGGTMGEIKIKNGTYESELRSAAQKLQQPYGRIYTLECDAQYGSERCGAKLSAQAWSAGMTAAARLVGDASVGTIVKPSVYNGFWYECTLAANAVSTGVNPGSWPPGLQTTLSGFMARMLAAISQQPLGLGGIANQSSLTIKYGTTGGSEPSWPTGVGATVVDGNVTWTAMIAREQPGTVTGLVNRARFDARNLAWVPDSFFKYGVLTWTSGQNTGARIEVRRHAQGTTAAFDLLEAMSYPIELGDTFTVVQGCAKTRSACLERNNIYNMQAFPDMPTEEKALTSPNYSEAGKDSGGSSKK